MEILKKTKRLLMLKKRFVNHKPSTPALTPPFKNFQTVAIGVLALGLIFFGGWQLFNYLRQVLASNAPTDTWREYCLGTGDPDVDLANPFAWQDSYDPRYNIYDLDTDTLGSSTAPYLIKTPCELFSLHDNPLNPQRPYAGKWLKLDPPGGVLNLQNHLWEPINIYGSESGSVFNDQALVHLDGNNTTIANLQVTGFTPARYYAKNDEIHGCDTGDPDIEQSDAECADYSSQHSWFASVGAAGLFGETYKFWTANYNLENPIVEITAPSGVTFADGEMAAEQVACEPQIAAQEVRCLEHESCPLNLDQALDFVTDPQGFFADVPATCTGGNYDTCTYQATDDEGNVNVARLHYEWGGLSSVDVTWYYYPDALVQKVNFYCYPYGCNFSYDFDNDDDDDFTANYNQNQWHFMDYNSYEYLTCSDYNAVLAEQAICMTAFAQQQQRCQDYGCYLNLVALGEKVDSIDWQEDNGGTVNCISGNNGSEQTCSYEFTDTNGKLNRAEKDISSDYGLMQGQIFLDYHYDNPEDGAAPPVRVITLCDKDSCTYSYFFTNPDRNEDDYDLQATCDLTGNCSYNDLANSSQLSCDGYGYDGLDMVGTLVGNARFTRITNVRVLNPQLTVSNLASGYSVGGMVGYASGWVYFMTTSVEDGTLQVTETPLNLPVSRLYARVVGGLVGVNYKSVVINAFTNSNIYYQMEKEAFQTLNYACAYKGSSLGCNTSSSDGLSILVGGIAGIADVTDESPIENINNVCIMNSFSAADIHLLGDYLPNYEMAEPIVNQLWGETYESEAAEFSQPRLLVGGIAAYIVDTMVNNYYRGKIYAAPNTQGEALREQLSEGREAVIEAITGHSLDEWDIELIDNWNQMVKDWKLEDGEQFPVHTPYGVPPNPPML